MTSTLIQEDMDHSSQWSKDTGKISPIKNNEINAKISPIKNNEIHKKIQ